MCTIYNFPKYYRLKVSSDSMPKGRLLGSLGFRNLVGEELAVKFLKRAEKSKSDKITCKLRRGLVFTFYVK